MDSLMRRKAEALDSVLDPNVRLVKYAMRRSRVYKVVLAAGSEWVAMDVANSLEMPCTAVCRGKERQIQWVK